MNDNDDLGRSVGRSVDQRVRHLQPRADFDVLLMRLEHSERRRRRWLVAAVVMALLVGVGVGVVLGSRSDSGSSRAVVALADGVPGPRPPSATFQPADVKASRAAVVQAFHDAFDGPVSEVDWIAATQDGRALLRLRAESVKRAEKFGYTPEQFAGTTVDVLDVSFIDDTHAVVMFTLTIPGHGPVLVDRVGYAILDGRRWRVALRTACDLLSLSGLGQECPPRS